MAAREFPKTLHLDGYRVRSIVREDEATGRGRVTIKGYLRAGGRVVESVVLWEADYDEHTEAAITAHAKRLRDLLREAARYRTTCNGCPLMAAAGPALQGLMGLPEARVVGLEHAETYRAGADVYHTWAGVDEFGQPEAYLAKEDGHTTRLDLAAAEKGLQSLQLGAT